MVRLESCSGIIMNRTYDQKIMNAKHGAFVLCIYVYISSIPKPLNILLSAESPLFEQWQVQVYECWVNNMIGLCLVLDAVQSDNWLGYYMCNLLDGLGGRVRSIILSTDYYFFMTFNFNLFFLWNGGGVKISFIMFNVVLAIIFVAAAWLSCNHCFTDLNFLFFLLSSNLLIWIL